MQDSLLALSPGERGSLVRFYVQGGDGQRICRELCTTPAEFRYRDGTNTPICSAEWICQFADRWEDSP